MNPWGGGTPLGHGLGGVLGKAGTVKLALEEEPNESPWGLASDSAPTADRTRNSTVLVGGNSVTSAATSLGHDWGATVSGEGAGDCEVDGVRGSNARGIGHTVHEAVQERFNPWRSATQTPVIGTAKQRGAKVQVKQKGDSDTMAQLKRALGRTIVGPPVLMDGVVSADAEVVKVMGGGVLRMKPDTIVSKRERKEDERTATLRAAENRAKQGLTATDAELAEVAKEYAAAQVAKSSRSFQLRRNSGIGGNTGRLSLVAEKNCAPLTRMADAAAQANVPPDLSVTTRSPSVLNGAVQLAMRMITPLQSPTEQQSPGPADVTRVVSLNYDREYNIVPQKRTRKTAPEKIQQPRLTPEAARRRVALAVHNASGVHQLLETAHAEKLAEEKQRIDRLRKSFEEKNAVFVVNQSDVDARIAQRVKYLRQQDPSGGGSGLGARREEEGEVTAYARAVEKKKVRTILRTKLHSVYKNWSSELERGHIGVKHHVGPVKSPKLEAAAGGSCTKGSVVTPAGRGANGKKGGKLHSRGGSKGKRSSKKKSPHGSTRGSVLPSPTNERTNGVSTLSTFMIRWSREGEGGGCTFAFSFSEHTVH